MFGVISSDEFESQLNDLTSPSKSSKVVAIQRGRGEKKEVPIEIKKIISEEAIAGAPAKSLAEAFGISPSSISAYKHDATSTSTYHEKNEELASHNAEVKDELTIAARGRLRSALASITDEKLSETKARDAAGIARDMSAVIKNLEPDRTMGQTLNQQFVFYAPKTRTESDFEMIEARE